MGKKVLSIIIVVALFITQFVPSYADGNVFINLQLSKTQYQLNETIQGNGMLTENGNPLKYQPFVMTIESFDGLKVYDVYQYTTDAEGKFSISLKMPYGTSYGEYVINVTAKKISLKTSFEVSTETSSNTNEENNKKKSSEYNFYRIKANVGKNYVKIAPYILRIQGKEKEIEVIIGGVTMYIQHGTFEDIDDSITLTMEKVQQVENYLPNEDTLLDVIGEVYEFKCDKTFNKPVTIRIPFSDEEVKDKEKLGVYYYNDLSKSWDYIGGSLSDQGYIEVKLNHFSKYALMVYDKSFDDIKNHWAKEKIEVLASHHLVHGMNDNNFEPNTNVTRAEFTQLLVNVLQLDKGTPTINFSDVSRESWYYEAIDIASSQGLIEGCDKYFYPEQELTREEMAVMLKRALIISGVQYDRVDKRAFNDEPDFSYWAKDAILDIQEAGLMIGVGGNFFAPKENATRAEAALVTYKLMELVRE